MKKLLFLVAVAIVSMISLTKLPVFSDEAIYIRWAQVATNDPKQYLFLSMLDGKPPLHVWSLMPILQLVSDPLLAGRLMSVVFGLIGLAVVSLIVKELGGDNRDELMAMGLLALMPFWFFHYRLALADTLLVMLFLIAIYAGIKIVRGKLAVGFVVLFALAFGGTLYVKTSALFFILPLGVLPLFAQQAKKKSISFISMYRSKSTGLLIFGGFVGGLLFSLLKISPLFPSLFSRSNDYTFSISSLLGGEWQHVLFSNLPGIAGWLAWYISPFIFALAVGERKKNRLLGLMALLYIAPLVVFGRVIYSRYFLPVAPLAAIAAAFGYKQLIASARTALIAKTIVVLFFLTSISWVLVSWLNPGWLPLARSDKQQYLTTWASGYGIPQVRDYLNDQLAQSPELIEVGTEGYFGTLPDGLQIYFNNPRYSGHISIDGVGEPVQEIPQKLIESAKVRRTFLVVNTDRFLVTNPAHYQVIQYYPRPRGGPSLALLRITP